MSLEIPSSSQHLWHKFWVLRGQACQEKLKSLGALTYLKLNLKVHRYCQITDTYTGRPDNGRIQLNMANKRCLMSF